MERAKAWRVTHMSRTGIARSVDRLRPIPIGQMLKTTRNGYAELRDSDENIARVGPNSEVVLEETSSGVCPVYHGEVCVIRGGGWELKNGKYRTSCYLMFRFGGPNAFYARPGIESNTDEYVAIFGELLIYDFDENNRPYTICCVPENKKAIVTVRPEQSGRNRYEATITDVPEDEYEYILVNYVGNKNWK